MLAPSNEQLHPAVSAALNELCTQCASYLADASLVRIKEAFQFAKDLHGSQTRRSGEPYIVHPLSVAGILAHLKMDETSLVAAILHDVVEDTHASVEQVKKTFGDEVAQIVDGLTKLSKVEFRSSQEKLAENFRKMILAMSKDIRVIIIKLADRTHNMMTIKALAPEKRLRIAEETLDIYAPLAGRLGIYRLKADLEDMSFKEIKPSVYFALAKRVEQKKSDRERIIHDLSQHICTHLKEANIEGEIEGRAKHLYSIYKKMTEKKMDFEDVYDLFGVRVFVDNVTQCYEALGVIHNHFRPVPGRFKDYIAMPKANLYQSLHTTVVTPKGELLEVQIRTHEMHHLCEYGIAAHWAYKESKRCERIPLSQDIEKFNWLKQIVRHQKELSDPNEFLEAVKVDLFEEEVYVFSPKGDVFELPRRSTILDFAFAVHTDLGLRTVGAKVNGRIATLRTELNSGDVVEILSSNSIKASKDWLSFVVTTKARNRVRQYLRAEERDEARRMGTDLLDEALMRLNSSFDRLQKSGQLQNVNQLLPVGSLDDLVLQIGFGKMDAEEVSRKLLGEVAVPQAESKTLAQLNADDFHFPLEQPNTQKSTPKRDSSSGSKSVEETVRVQGMDGLLVRLAKCCEPLPGQPIIGFVARGRGVTIHAATCEWALMNDPARRVDCSWNTSRSGDYAVRLRLTTHDRAGVLADITKTISQLGINIAGAEVQTTPDQRGIITVRVKVESIAQLKDVQQKLEAVEGVITVERMTG